MDFTDTAASNAQPEPLSSTYAPDTRAFECSYAAQCVYIMFTGAQTGPNGLPSHTHIQLKSHYDVGLHRSMKYLPGLQLDANKVTWNERQEVAVFLPLRYKMHF